MLYVVIVINPGQYILEFHLKRRSFVRLQKIIWVLLIL